jgi:hypothetical protein
MEASLPQSILHFVHHRLVGNPNEEDGSRRKVAFTFLSILAFSCLAAYCALGAVATTVGGARLIRNQTDNTYPESTNIYSAIDAARTGHLYASPSAPPYVLQSFGPLYYVINATIAQASHLDFDLIRIRARLLSYSCFLLSSVIIFLICMRSQFSAANSALAALLFLGQPYFLTWNVTARPDMLFLTMMLCSLLFVLEDDTLGDANYVLGGILAGLAFLVKQPGVAAPIAVLAILVYKKKFRSAAIFLLSVGLPVVLMFGFLLWHEGHFMEQVTSVSKGVWSLREGAIFVSNKLFNRTMIVPIAIGAIGFAQAVRTADSRSLIVAAFAVANWLVGFSGLPQLGANINYFLPGLAACALLLPYAMQMIGKNVHSKAYLAVIVLVLLFTIPQEAELASWAFSAALQPAERNYLPLGSLRILSDRPIFTVHGRDPDLLDPFTAHELELARHWDPSPIVENIEGGGYDLVVLEQWHLVSNFRGVAFFSPAIVKAINENYRVLCSTLTSAVLEPNVREVAITAATLGPALGQPCGMGLHGRPPNLIIPPGVR